jgi:transcriptional regulator with XRE-family HTH domain
MTNGKPRRTKFPANLVGPQIRKLRSARGWSQAKFAVQLQLKGLDMGRDVVARIECRIHCIRDKDILLFARTLGVEVSKLFSSLEEKNSRG